MLYLPLRFRPDSFIRVEIRGYNSTPCKSWGCGKLRTLHTEITPISYSQCDYKSFATWQEGVISKCNYARFLNYFNGILVRKNRFSLTVCCMEFIDFSFSDDSQYYLYDKQ